MLVHIVTGEKEYVTEIPQFDATYELAQFMEHGCSVDPKKTVKVIRRIIPGDAAKKRPAYQEHLFFPLDNPHPVDLNDRAYEGCVHISNITMFGILNPSGPIARLYYKQMGRVIVPGPGAKQLV